MYTTGEQKLMKAAKAIGELPKPRSDEELAVLSLLCFGKPVELGSLRLYGGGSGDYRVAPVFDEMFSEAFYKLYGVSSYNCRLYDYAGSFWKHCIGKLYCGGIAGSSYGQFRTSGHRDTKRLEHWIECRRSNRVSDLRPPFARLARQLRGGKNREIRGIPVLISGREDGAEAAFSEQAA